MALVESVQATITANNNYENWDMVKLRADLQIGSYWATTDSLRCVANLNPSSIFTWVLFISDAIYFSSTS